MIWPVTKQYVLALPQNAWYKCQVTTVVPVVCSDPVPDVPAIYFCQPSDENLQRIGQDLEANLYGTYHFNFLSPISRQKIEDLASKAIQANVVSQV